MKIIDRQKLPRITIHPGENYVTKKNEIISTLLGSCVAACLYDPVNRVIGMNHFLLAQQNVRKSAPILTTDEGRYGIHAMELLINAMFQLGAQRKYLKAKAFGGGDVLMLSDKLKGGKSIGAGNCEFIRTFLATENIPLLATDLGGNIGRNIFFLPTDFSVYVKPIEIANQQAIVKEERQFLAKKIIAGQSSIQNQADFW